ncbi:hypothetical protein [Myceligenerans salitolerans]|uniref:Uncharacterized protein n=1 Tax=Myceligenerans salitolerans TaxID=1230528 RepID=A0ABS3I7X7_9MICO|nr:hypothetical protein [Myceligenerans salitolerans]MBO0609117.1 hypothetical protein [Myceligenerans salitolerans]
MVSVLRWAFLEIRAVRYPAEARSGVVIGLAKMIRGAGAALFSISTINDVAARDERLRDLITQLATRSPGASRWIRQQLGSTQTGRPDLAAQITELPAVPQPTRVLEHERAEIRHLSWTSSRWPHGNRPTEFQAVLAIPDQHDVWRAAPITHTGPNRVLLTTTTYEVGGRSHRSTP